MFLTKFFSAIALSAVLLSGCSTEPPEPTEEEIAAVEAFIYGTIGDYSEERSKQATSRWTSTRDEFSGVAFFRPPRDDLDYIRGERASGDAMVYPVVGVLENGEVVLAWHVSYMGFGWMFLEEMLVRVDDETLSFPVQPSYDQSRDVMSGSKVRENSTEVFSRFQLSDYAQLADASNARFRLVGSDKNLERDFTSTELKLVREGRDIYLGLTQ